MKNVSFALIQLSCSTSVSENWQKTISSIREAARKGAQVICLQELFKSVYFCYEEKQEFFALAEAIPGPSTEELGALAAELNVVIVASLFEKRAAGLYHNTTAVIDADGKYLGKYRKMHIPDAGINGIQRLPVCSPCEVPRSCSIRQPSGGSLQTKKRSARASMKLGKP